VSSAQLCTASARGRGSGGKQGSLCQVGMLQKASEAVGSQGGAEGLPGGVEGASGMCWGKQGVPAPIPPPGNPGAGAAGLPHMSDCRSLLEGLHCAKEGTGPGRKRGSGQTHTTEHRPPPPRDACIEACTIDAMPRGTRRSNGNHC